MTTTEGPSANPFLQPIEENLTAGEHKTMTMNHPLLALWLGEQDPQMKDFLEGDVKDSENEGLAGTPEALNPSPEGYANILLPHFQTLSIP